MKRILKGIVRWIKLHVLPPIGALLLFIIFKTVRWVRNDLDRLHGSAPFIAAFWHGRQLMLAPLYQSGSFKFRLSVLISGHTDGRLIANAIKYFGLGSVSGSSSRGGARALMQLIEIVQSGACVGITPDGPRGPIYKVKEGVIKLAEITGVPIVPIVYGGQSVWQLGSWDAMILPKPFSQAVCLVGEPLHIGRDLSPEELSLAALKLESMLNSLREQADKFQYE